MASKTSGYKYDFNVIYNHAESRLAKTDDTITSLEFTKCFVNMMERSGLKKAYYYDRDALPGKNKFTELFRILNSSQWTVVIFTKGFKKNCWSLYSQQASFMKLIKEEKGERLIPIALGVSEIQPELDIIYKASFGETKDDWYSLDAKAEWDKLVRLMRKETDQVLTHDHEGKPRTDRDMPLVQETDSSSRTYYQEVLQGCHETLVENLDPELTLDSMLTEHMITQSQYKDVRDQVRSSEKTREIKRILSSKDEAGYEKFKTILKRTGQDFVHTELLEEETKVTSKRLQPATQNIERLVRVSEAVVTAPSGSTFSTAASSQVVDLSASVPTGPTVSVPRGPSPIPASEQPTGSQEEPHTITQTSSSQQLAQLQQVIPDQPQAVGEGAETSATAPQSLQEDGVDSSTEATIDSAAAVTPNKPDITVREKFSAPQSTVPASRNHAIGPQNDDVSTVAPQLVDEDAVTSRSPNPALASQNGTAPRNTENIQDRVDSSEVESITTVLAGVDFREDTDLSMDQASLPLQPGNKTASDRFSDSGYSSPGDPIRSAVSEFAMRSDGKQSEVRTELPVGQSSGDVPGERIPANESNNVVVNTVDSGDTQGFEIQEEESLSNDAADNNRDTQSFEGQMEKAMSNEAPSNNLVSQNTANDNLASNSTANNSAARINTVVYTENVGEAQCSRGQEAVSTDAAQNNVASNITADLSAAGDNVASLSAAGDNVASNITASLNDTEKSGQIARENTRMGPEGEEANTEDDANCMIQEAPIEKVEVSKKLQAVKPMTKNEIEESVHASRQTSTITSSSAHAKDYDQEPSSLTKKMLRLALRWYFEPECAFSGLE